MFRKPLSIYILSLVFLFSPIAILIFNAAVNMVPLIGYGSIFYRLQLFDRIILLLYIITGISIFLVRKWGWWVIISSASLMFLYNLITFFFNPFSSLMVLLLMNLALFATALIFFRKHMIAPYFNPRLRWWEQDQRYEIDIYLKFLGIDKNVIISDISAGGCYIYVDFLIDKGSELPVLIVCGSFHITVTAKIMRIAKESEQYYGYGLMFQKIEEIEKEGLYQLIRKLKTFSSFESDNADTDEKRSASRYFIGYNLSILSEEEHCPANLLDISRSGCAIHTSNDMAANSNCLFNFRVEQENYKIISKVIWKKGEQGSRHYGLKFIGLERKNKIALKKMIIYAEKLGAKKRKMSKSYYNQQCEEKLDRTPYVIIRKVKNLFK